MKNAAAMITAVTLLVTPAAFGKKKGPPQKPPSARPHIGGAVSVVPVPWGLVSLGGRVLRQLPAGKKSWEPLHEEVRGHELHRVSAHPSGKLLAVWENDLNLHLFVPAKKQHLRFPKPFAPTGMNLFDVRELYISSDGRWATVYMQNAPPRPPSTTMAYRYDLENLATPPKLLFEQKGLDLHLSARTALFAVPKDLGKQCYSNYMGCWPIAEIRGWELGDAGATSKVLKSGDGDRMELAREVFGSDDDQVALLIEERNPKARGLLRWSYGKEKAEFQPLPPAARSEIDASRLTKSGDVVEVILTDDWGLSIERHSPAGERRAWSFPQLPRRLRMKDTGGVKVVKERANGDLFVHWSDYLLLVPKSEPSRLMLLVTLLGEREWAGADIYVSEPEALWVGVERRGRDFYYLTFDEIEKIAKPWPDAVARAR